MRTIVSTLALIVVAHGAHLRAQEPCAAHSEWEVAGTLREMPAQTAGARDWKIPAKELSAITAQARGLVELLSRLDFVAHPKGMQVGHYRAIGTPTPGTSTLEKQPYPRHVEAMFFPFVCVDGTVKRRWTDADVGLSIDVNTLFSVLDNTQMTLNGKPVYELHLDLGEYRGHRLFMPPTSQPRDPSGFDRSVLVARPGRLPFAYVTRQQLLDYWAAEMDRASGAQPGMANAPFVARRKRLDALRARYTAGQLREPAVIPARSSTFWGALDAEGWDFVSPTVDPSADCAPRCRFGQYLVTLDADYFDPTMPASSPQFFVVTIGWMGTPDDSPTKKRIRDESLASFDFDAFAAMMRK